MTDEKKRGPNKGLKKPDDYTYIGKFAIHKEKFFSRLVENENGCLLWNGGTHRQGYGMFNVYNVAENKRQMNVSHRIAMMLHLNREFGRDDFVIHEFCDNQLCCNPAHMIVGTSFDRNRVAAQKGHRPTGKPRGVEQCKKQNRAYKWTEEEMRFMRDNGNKIIAERFGVTPQEASIMRKRIRTGYKWLD